MQIAVGLEFFEEEFDLPSQTIRLEHLVLRELFGVEVADQTCPFFVGAVPLGDKTVAMDQFTFIGFPGNIEVKSLPFRRSSKNLTEQAAFQFSIALPAPANFEDFGIE